MVNLIKAANTDYRNRLQRRHWSPRTPVNGRLWQSAKREALKNKPRELKPPERATIGVNRSEVHSIPQSLPLDPTPAAP